MGELKERGFYTINYPWAKDKTTGYFAGFNMKIGWPVAKTIFIASIFYLIRTYLDLSTFYTSLICLLITGFYQDLVALIIPNTIRMPPMDQQTFLSRNQAVSNYINCSLQDKKCVEAAQKNFIRALKMKPKMRYKIKVICGDYYYEEMTVEETI